jgi:hypothetical protein
MPLQYHISVPLLESRSPIMRLFPPPRLRLPASSMHPLPPQQRQLPSTGVWMGNFISGVGYDIIDNAAPNT